MTGSFVGCAMKRKTTSINGIEPSGLSEHVQIFKVDFNDIVRKGYLIVGIPLTNIPASPDFYVLVLSVTSQLLACPSLNNKGIPRVPPRTQCYKRRDGTAPLVFSTQTYDALFPLVLQASLCHDLAVTTSLTFVWCILRSARCSLRFHGVLPQILLALTYKVIPNPQTSTYRFPFTPSPRPVRRQDCQICRYVDAGLARR